MAQVRWNATLPRVLIDDVRGGNRFLRVTVHRDLGVVVISHWQGDECVAATRVPMSAIDDLIELLREGATTP
ncbi:MAG: hypothetical protein QOK28_1580 [Actinomycetota bacterium]